MKTKGIFITLEGTDGVGKSTHAKLLKSWLEKKGKKVLLTREPGGGPISEKIRKILLDPRTTINNLTELFLYEAARVEHTEKIIRPALKKGYLVVCDRFTDATVAYQGFARKLPLATINILNQIAAGGLTPHLTVLLDLDPHVGLGKAQLRSKKKNGDRLENEGVKFQKKVRSGYLYLLKKEKKRIVKISVQDKIESTQDQIRAVIKKRFHL